LKIYHSEEDSELVPSSNNFYNGGGSIWVNMSFATVAEAYEKEGMLILYSQKNMPAITRAGAATFQGSRLVAPLKV